MAKKNQWIALIVLCALLLPSTLAAAAERTPPSADPVRAVVVYDGAGWEEAGAALAEAEGVKVLWRYERLFQGAAVEAAPDALKALEALPGVAAVRPARSYVPASADGEETGEEQLPEDGCLELMGVDRLWEEGYTGDGAVIAVLDSGLCTTHETFADETYTAAPALSREDVDGFIARGGTAGRYISRRIPFAYDYYDCDDDVTTYVGHGTHVTALAAGYAETAGGEVLFRGAAPGAQILSMKVFPDGDGGTDDTVILRALEDAWNLGADVVNLSVSTGAGFSQDDLLDGLYSRAFSQMADTGVLICCAVGNENTASAAKPWQPALPTAAYTDYGSAYSPASYRGAIAVGSAARAEDGGAVIADYSSWGPASGLHLVPALTGFGGPSVSASASADGIYRSDSGTSMASGSVSGVFAVLLQVLRERGITDKVQAALLARSLLESSARVLTGEDGVPVSPRKQGNGLADLEAAVSSELVILSPEAELGESAEGRFSLSLTLRNLSENPLTASLSVTALTDGCEERDGVWYSALTARDITGDVAVSGADRVTLAAGEEKTVSLELAVSSRLQEELAEVFSNGFYVEGFVTASAGAQEVHAAFLGYCGDWEAAPVLEQLDFHDVENEQSRQNGSAQENALWTAAPESLYLGPLGAELGANMAFLTEDARAEAEDSRLLGSNGYQDLLHDSGRNAMPGRTTDAILTAGDLLCLDLYTLRDAAVVAVLVSNPETGEIYAARDETWLAKSALDSYGEHIEPSARFVWDGTDAKGVALPNATQARVDVYAWLDTETELQTRYQETVHPYSPDSYRWLLESGYEDYRELSFPVTIDSAAPTVSAQWNSRKKTLTLSLRDGGYLAYAAAGDQSGWLLGEEFFAPAEAGETGTLTLDLSACETLPETVFIQAEDYASNMMGYELDLAALSRGEQVRPERCVMFLLRDMQISDPCHEAVDYAVGTGMLTIDGEMNFRPAESLTRAELVSALWRTSSTLVMRRYDASTLPFSDVTNEDSFTDALGWAYERELVSGRSDGSFGGGDAVTRQELAAILYRCAQLAGKASSSGDLSAFPDSESVDGWAVEAVAWAADSGLFPGGQPLSPKSAVTRAEAAQILMQFVELGS